MVRRRGCITIVLSFFFQAEDGIRDLVRSRGLGDVYKRQIEHRRLRVAHPVRDLRGLARGHRIHMDGPEVVRQTLGIRQALRVRRPGRQIICLLYTSDAADERSSVDLGGRRIIKKKTHTKI